MRVIACDGEKSWVQAGVVGEWMDGWIEGTFCSSCAGSNSYCSWWGRVSFMIQGPFLSKDGKETWPLWRPLHSFLKEHQIKHAWGGDRGGPATSLFTFSLSALCFTLLSQKKKHLEDCVSLMLGELKVEVTALLKQELSCVLPVLNHLNRYL